MKKAFNNDYCKLKYQRVSSEKEGEELFAAQEKDRRLKTDSRSRSV